MSHALHFRRQQLLAVWPVVLFILLSECDVCVHETAHHADVDADAVEPREEIVAAYEHPNIRDADIFKASDDGRGESGVVLGAEHGAVVKHKAHDTG